MAVVGRVRQTLQALTAWMRPVDDTSARNYLSAAEYALFLRMSRSDRQHHLRVLRHVLAARGAEADNAALWVAALLHDVGKTQVRFTIADRIIAVAVKKLLPRKFDEWSQGEPVGWRKAMVVSAQHPAWGAELLQEAGASTTAILLVAHHQDPLATAPPAIQPHLAILQAADDLS